MLAKFGPAGNPDAFYADGHKTSVKMPAWLASQGLNAYEYSCSRGVNIGEETAKTVGQSAKEHGISMSIHAPYYINLATIDETIAQNTQKHFLKTLEAACWFGADTVVFHMGSPVKQPRDMAFERVKKLFSKVLDETVKRGLNHIKLAPETMGKKNQLGSLEEVLSLCTMADWVVPAVDFGHLHAVTGGLYTTKNEVATVFEQVEQTLGLNTANNLHVHFSSIEYTPAGERRHWTFDDGFGPDYKPLIEVIAEKGYAPRIICESAGTQAKDARTMQAYYLSQYA